MEDRLARLSRWAFYVLLLLYVSVTLGQRSFPTQDGPGHLYYADVLSHLIAGDGAYGHSFLIKHWFPPYAFHTYVLIALNRFFDPLLSEKILVSLYLVWFCFAFRYLVQAVDPGNETFPLLAFPFVMNRTVFLGFYNFSFGVATTLLVAGYWLRYHERLTPKRIAILFLAMLFLAMTHPVALFVALMFIGIHVALIFRGEYEAANGTSRIRMSTAFSNVRRPLICLLCAGAGSAAWILSFTRSGGLIWMWNWLRMGALAIMAPLTPFRQTPYRILLALPAATIAVLALWRWGAGGRSRVLARESALMVASVLCVLIYAAGPFEVNYGAYFPQRFPIFGLAFAAAFAAALRLNVRARISMVAGIAVISVACLVWQAVMKQKIIDNLALVYDAPVAPALRRALVISAEPITQRTEYPQAFNPYLWAGLHYLRRSHAVFLNGVWLDAPIAMLEPAREHRCSFQDPFPMAECLAGVPDDEDGRVPGAGVGPFPEADILIALDRGVPTPEWISTDYVASSLGMSPTSMRTGFLRIFARP